MDISNDSGLEHWLRLRLTAMKMNRSEYLDHLVMQDLREPVLVWQMGKVASRSFVDAIERTEDYPVFHLHHTDRQTVESLRSLHDRRGTPYPPNLKLSIEVLGSIGSLHSTADRKVRIVSAVRDPMARNVSAFFMNLAIFVGKDAKAHADPQLLAQKFIRDYPHTVPLTWFDRELRATVGIDVYDTPFDHDRRSLRITTDRFDVLILRAEDSDPSKEAALNGFFDRDDIEIVRSNEASAKSYADVYQQFFKELIIPLWLVDEIYESRFAHHFYTDAEREEMRARWRTPTAAVEKQVDALLQSGSQIRKDQAVELDAIASKLHDAHELAGPAEQLQGARQTPRKLLGS